jgi:hypothetical protein
VIVSLDTNGRRVVAAALHLGASVTAPRHLKSRPSGSSASRAIRTSIIDHSMRHLEAITLPMATLASGAPRTEINLYFRKQIYMTATTQ